MREILFRGKRADNGEWIFGICLNENHIGIFHDDTEEEDCNIEVFQITPKTIGQYIGLTNKNGKRIFEGDILSYRGKKASVSFITHYGIPCFTTGIGSGSSTAFHPYKITEQHVIIGNIYDNPDLLD